MHNEVRVRNLGVNFFDAANREYVAGRRAAEFISTVACAYRDGESVDDTESKSSCKKWGRDCNRDNPAVAGRQPSSLKSDKN